MTEPFTFATSIPIDLQNHWETDLFVVYMKCRQSHTKTMCHRLCPCSSCTWTMILLVSLHFVVSPALPIAQRVVCYSLCRSRRWVPHHRGEINHEPHQVNPPLLHLKYNVIRFTIHTIPHHKIYITYNTWSQGLYHLQYLITRFISPTIPDHKIYITYNTWSQGLYHLQYLITRFISPTIPDHKDRKSVV